jgi:hypothetical protein
LAANGTWNACPTSGSSGASTTMVLQGSAWPSGVPSPASADGGTWNAFTSFHMYLKWIHVWSCADWQTTMCNGPVLNGPP